MCTSWFDCILCMILMLYSIALLCFSLCIFDSIITAVHVERDRAEPKRYLTLRNEERKRHTNNKRDSCWAVNFCCYSLTLTVLLHSNSTEWLEVCWFVFFFIHSFCSIHNHLLLHPLISEIREYAGWLCLPPFMPHSLCTHILDSWNCSVDNRFIRVQSKHSLA